MGNIETIEHKNPQLGKIRVGVRFKAPFMADCLTANPPYSSKAKPKLVNGFQFMADCLTANPPYSSKAKPKLVNGFQFHKHQ
jgi:hypothetical protein